MNRVNGTHAKEIALHFLDATEQRYTSAIIGKTINQAKVLLKAGYSKEEIIKSIDYVINKTDINMYSLGYIISSINDILRKIHNEEMDKQINELKSKAEKEKEKLERYTSNEVIKPDESTDRNRRKARKSSIQSRKRKESYFDMLKE